jgi:hypothetical protein
MTVEAVFLLSMLFSTEINKNAHYNSIATTSRESKVVWEMQMGILPARRNACQGKAKELRNALRLKDGINSKQARKN